MAEHKQELVVHVSTKTYLKALAVAAGVFLAWYLSSIIFILAVALLLAALILPFAQWAETKRIPRAVAVLGVYLVLIAALSTVGALLVPPLVMQGTELFKSVSVLLRDWLPNWLDVRATFSSLGLGEPSVSAIGTGIGGIFGAAQGVFGTVRGVIGDIVAAVLMLVIAFYIVVEEAALRDALRAVVPTRQYHLVSQALAKAQAKIALWLRGQLILMLIIGLVMYGGLALLGVRYAAVLGLFAGITEFIPYVGPLLGVSLAFIIALADSPVKALLVLVLGIIVQQLENHVLVPKVMQKAVGINPLVSILAVMVGARLGGVIGALVAIPIATSAIVFVQDYLALRRGEQPRV